MSRVRPQTIRIASKGDFVLLPISEFQKMQEAYEDAKDVLALRKARTANAGKPTLTLDQLKTKLGYGRRGRSK